jgi:hypothetical protein
LPRGWADGLEAADVDLLDRASTLMERIAQG